MCMHIHIYMYIHTCAQPAANALQMCTLMSKEHLYNAYSCTCVGAQNTRSKVHATPTAKKCTYIYTYTHMHTHTYAQEYICTHASTPGTTALRLREELMQTPEATAWGADADAGSSARLFRWMKSTTFSTSNARTSLYSLPETPITLNPPSPLPNIPQNSSRTAASADLPWLFHTDQHNRVHHSDEVPRSFTMAPCVVVERLEGMQRCSKAPIGDHAGRRARKWPKWLFTRNERSTKNNEFPQLAITPSRQRGAQTTPAHLHWCRADPPSSWPAQAADYRGDSPKRGHICAIFAGVSIIYRITTYHVTLMD